ncbi:cytochrome P450 [Crucibulum laeve]|uniref:Cytochrome P450 n=1 Tax=Crucibulum laeve TaxID=68775 RepID=A0A5C3LTN2_9AGAR|nr:cytochrome P450 [Crucibulum laeve]
MTLLVTLYFSALYIALIVLFGKMLRKHPQLPPGPPPDPIIGHLRLIPKDNNEKFFYDLSKTYGKVMHLRIPGQVMIILNSAKAAIDLLDKRSSIYSDRASSEVFMLMGWGDNVTFFPYGKRFQKHRKMLQEYFHQKKCEAYFPLQAQEAQRLLQNFMSNPNDFGNHIRKFATCIIIRITYGHNVTSADDPYLKITGDVGHCLTNCGSPGSNIVDLIPCLKYFPSWFPGTFYAHQARSYKPIIDVLHHYPFEDVQKQMATGTIEGPSYLQYHLEQLQRDHKDCPFDISDIQGTSGVIYGAGADTTWSTVLIFMLAMVLHPHVQIKAQEEIDRLLGTGRLPGFSDRPILPYMECVVQESYRWNNAVPAGIPHRSLEDDIYNGMFIPKGSIIVANTRGISMDEDVYSDPALFNPDRYLPKPHGNAEPYLIGQFGFGRRICPGRHLADASVWIAIASVLATFSISKSVGDDGKEITPDLIFETGITSHPKPFKCKITPRSQISRSAINQGSVWAEQY